ncbi:MAG: hypothetical protein IIA62_01140, partial [Nitrospinae bacterium]|nr:hypothetical protein [Nitrospinota bacterium]
MRQVVAARALAEGDFRKAEDLRDLYFHAAGLADLPLFEKPDKSGKNPGVSRSCGPGALSAEVDLPGSIDIRRVPMAEPEAKRAGHEDELRV